MELKKGFFFSLDAFMALSLFVLILISMYLFFINSSDLNQQYYFSEDLFDVFSNIKLEELELVKYPQIIMLSLGGGINNSNLSLSEIIVDFSINGNSESASILIEDLTEGLVPARFGISFELEEEIFSRGEERQALVARSRLLSG